MRNLPPPAWFRVVSFAAILFMSVLPVHASWPIDPNLNLPVCRALKTQYGPAITPSASGGVYVAWTDNRSSDDTTPTDYYQPGDIYLQRITANGAVAPGWPLDGVPVCTLPRRQDQPVLVPDGEGGVYVAWQDYRVFDADVYLQRITRAGTVAPGWPENGLAVCALGFDQNQVVAVADGSGGIVLAWTDVRDTYANDIYGQRILPNGTIAAGWSQNGIALCKTPTPVVEAYPAITTDRAGGAIVAWSRRINLTPDGIFAQHVTSDGRVDPRWPVNGLRLSSHAEVFSGPRILGVGGGPTWVVWNDGSSGSQDVYFNAISAAPASVPATLSGDGIPLCDAANDQTEPRVSEDGSGGVLVVWTDDRNTSTFSNQDIYGQHLDAHGTVSQGWPANGVQVCGAAGQQIAPVLASDGLGGAIVSWVDMRMGYGNIYSQHITAEGATDARWPTDGRALSYAPYGQNSPEIISDGAGGATVVWADSRAAIDGKNFDIYAQRVNAAGTLGGVIPNTAESIAFSMYPNPASSSVEFTLPANGQEWEVVIFDLSGRKQWSGRGGLSDLNLRWTGRTNDGKAAPPGMYVVRFSAGGKSYSRRLAWLR